MAARQPFEVVFSRDMGIGHAEFFRTLHSAFGGRARVIDDALLIIEEPTRRVEIELSPESERRIASMKMPLTRATFRFTNHTQADIERFMARFDLYFHRGGG